MAAGVEWEEWVIDFTGTVVGVTGSRVVCGSVSDRDAWLAANGAAAGQIVVSRRCCTQSIHAVHGLPGGTALPSTPTRVPPGAARACVPCTVNRFGAPNVPPGFQP